MAEHWKLSGGKLSLIKERLEQLSLKIELINYLGIIDTLHYRGYREKWGTRIRDILITKSVVQRQATSVNTWDIVRNIEI